MSKERQAVINRIRSITKKYNWDSNEEYKLEEILKDYGKKEFESALVIKDAILINKLEEIVRDRNWKLIFNHDDQDGFFVEVQEGYHNTDIVLADLKPETKRESLIDAILAAIEFYKH